MASPAAPALKTLGSSPRNPGQMSWITGVTKLKAKNPNATVGTPASTSRVGFKSFRTRGRAYSLK